jgi:hypothetical protein
MHIVKIKTAQEIIKDMAAKYGVGYRDITKHSTYREGTIHIVHSNSGGPISASAWKNLMTLLESNGYTWCTGVLPTQSNKCPNEISRYLHVSKDKTLMLGQPHVAIDGHIDNKLLIKLNDFKKLLK